MCVGGRIRGQEVLGESVMVAQWYRWNRSDLGALVLVRVDSGRGSGDSDEGARMDRGCFVVI